MIVNFVLFMACTGAPGGDSAFAEVGPRDTADTGADSLPDPSTYDCRADATPERASVVPVQCALDPACLTVQVAAHRGAGGELGVFAPEDTLSAYRAGIALGVEFVETDPRPTSDGVLVNIHDTSVDRTTDGTGEVDQMTLAQVQALAVNAQGLDGDFSCERIPTLLEVLQTCRGRVVVLVDANKTDRVDLLVQAIEEADAVDWAVFDTSSVDKIEQALALNPDLHVQPRPGLDEIASQLDRLAPVLPELVELDWTERAKGAVIVHDYGTRAFSDVFLEDAQATVTGDVQVYDQSWGDGLDVVQTERPDLVVARLKALGLR